MESSLQRARAVTLLNYHEMARNVGLDPFVMLGRAGLHPSQLRDPENWIAASRILSLLEESARKSDNDDFGVLLGECRSFASLGPVSLLMKHAMTLGDAIRGMIEYRKLLNDLLHFELRDDGRTVTLEWALVPGLHSSQGVNLLATIAYRVLVDGNRWPWRPECLHFRHKSPKSISTFRRVFNCPLEFGSGFDGMSFDTSDLAIRNEFGDAELAGHARRLLNLMPGIWHTDTIRDRVRGVLPSLVANGRAQLEDVADCLGMSGRTLQRQLIAEGQSFNSLLNEVRRELATRYLADSDQSLTTVAHLVGYSSLSSFTRWFISESRMTPGQRRAELRRGDALQPCA